MFCFSVTSRHPRYKQTRGDPAKRGFYTLCQEKTARDEKKSFKYRSLSLPPSRIALRSDPFPDLFERKKEGMKGIKYKKPWQ